MPPKKQMVLAKTKIKVSIPVRNNVPNLSDKVKILDLSLLEIGQH
jgi:hypothetical protein